MGVRVAKKIAGKSHKNAKSEKGKFALNPLLINSKIIKGSVRKKPMSAGVRRFGRQICMLGCGHYITQLPSTIVLGNSVEMPGIEPGSERFDPRNSTSVVGRGLSSQRSRPTGTLCDQPLVFRTVSGVVCGTPPLFRPIRHLAEEGAGGRDALGRQLLYRSLMQRGA